MAFDGLRVLSLESRRAKEMEALIRREGGVPFVAPSVMERALDDHDDARKFIERLARGDFDLVVCMTAAGLAFLREIAVADGSLELLTAGLQTVSIISRGPKPVPILREFGKRADHVVPEPNTWREVVEAITQRPERRIAIQEYGRPNEELSLALRALNAEVSAFAIYRWDLPADTGPLREAAQRLANRELDVVLFTSSIQLEHLLQIAAESGLKQDVINSLRDYTAVASVGPVMTETLVNTGMPPDVIPVHPKMAALVKASSEQAAGVIARKRTL